MVKAEGSAGENARREKVLVLLKSKHFTWPPHNLRRQILGRMAGGKTQCTSGGTVRPCTGAGLYKENKGSP